MSAREGPKCPVSGLASLDPWPDPVVSVPSPRHAAPFGSARVSEGGELVDQLQHLVLTRLAELGERGRPMSARRAAERSRGQVSYDTLYLIAKGQHSGRLTDRVAQGLADALGVPVDRVYDAAGQPRPQTRWQPPQRFDRLTLAQRQLLEDLASALLEADQRGYERGMGERRGEN